MVKKWTLRVNLLLVSVYIFSEKKAMSELVTNANFSCG